MLPFLSLTQQAFSCTADFIINFTGVLSFHFFLLISISTSYLLMKYSPCWTVYPLPKHRHQSFGDLIKDIIVII